MSTGLLQIWSSVVIEIFSGYPRWFYICFKWKYFKEQFSQINRIGISAEGADKSIEMELNLVVIWRAACAAHGFNFCSLVETLTGHGRQWKTFQVFHMDFSGFKWCTRNSHVQTHENIWEQHQNMFIVFEKSHLHGEWRNSKPRVNFSLQNSPLTYYNCLAPPGATLRPKYCV